jgi:site-specific DNA-methyltransferase (adenine-specific)
VSSHVKEFLLARKRDLEEHRRVNRVCHREALDVLQTLADASIDLIYTDPPFGTQTYQKLDRQRGGQLVSSVGYLDRFDDYMGFMRPHLVEMRRVLKPSGTLYLHLDFRWSHYVKVALDEVFGRDCFLNEVVWAYDFGGRGRCSWPRKHDNILVYVREPGQHVFNWDDIDRLPYAAPEMQRVGRNVDEVERRIATGKVPTDVWLMSIVGTNSRERTGYPNQKPQKLVERIVLASSPPGGLVLDVFAGSGTTGAAAYKHGRQFVLADISPWALETMRKRFERIDVEWIL